MTFQLNPEAKVLQRAKELSSVAVTNQGGNATPQAKKQGWSREGKGRQVDHAAQVDSGVADCDRFLFSAEKDRPISLSWGTKDVDYLWGNDYTWIPCGIERRDGDTFFESKSNCDEDLSLALQFELGHGPDDQLNTSQGTGSQGWSWTLQSQGGDHESRFEESFYSFDDVMHTARSFAQNFQQIVRHLWDDAYTWMKHSKGSETINCIDSVLTRWNDHGFEQRLQ